MAVINELLKAAMGYAELGWPVVPVYAIDKDGGCSCRKGKNCSSKGKHPRLIEWQAKATTNPNEIQDWWTKWPDSNVDVANQFVVDVDGPEGIASLKGREWPLTSTAITGNGKHYHYNWPKVDFQIKNDSRILPGVDIKVENEQVVMPPSRHYSGKTYEWAVSPDEAQLADLPNGLLMSFENTTAKRQNREKNQKHS